MAEPEKTNSKLRQITHILREINSDEFRMSKAAIFDSEKVSQMAILTILKALILHFSTFKIYEKQTLEVSKCKILPLKIGKKVDLT